MNPLRRLIASDIPFARDEAHRLLPVMVACLMAFAALLLAVALSVNTALTDRSQGIIGMIQVELPRTLADDRTVMQSLVQVLKETKGVERVTVVTTAEMETMLKPWLGRDFTLDDLPVPVIIDIKTAVKDQETAVDLKALRQTLATINSNIKLDDRGPWVSDVAEATALFKLLVLLVAGILLSCVIGMIVLVAKTNLRLHFKTVSLLHMFGATDEYILRQFQWNSAWLAVRGAVIGVSAAAIVFVGVALLSMRWQSPVLPEIRLHLVHGAMFLALPLFTAFVALVATRRTVSTMLHNMH